MRAAVNSLRFVVVILTIWILYLMLRNHVLDREISFQEVVHPKQLPPKLVQQPKNYYCDSDCGEGVQKMENIMEEESKQFNDAMEYLGLNGENIPYYDTNEVSLEDIVFVTAFTSSYLRKAKRSCASFSTSEQFKKFGKKIRLIAFDLGGNSAEDLKQYAKDCPQADVRKFPFEKFPKYVQSAMEYRFKALAIALAMKEGKAVFWMDTSIVFNNIGNGTLQSHFDEMKQSGRPVSLFFFSSHSIAAATDPAAYKYLPIANSTAVERRMYDANSQLWFGTHEAKQKILRRYVQCSLIQQCMAPNGARVFCSFGPDRKFYANCHRFDQSTVNIILNLYTNDNIAGYVRDFAQWVPNRDAA